MIITKAALENLRTGFSTLFSNGLKAAEPKSAPLCTEVNSTTKVETYGFLADLPMFRKWLGEKRIQSLKEKSYVLVNDDYEVSIGIHKNKIRDDTLGLYGPQIQGWGQSGGQLKDKLNFDALRFGHKRPCFDDQNFFDTEHPAMIRDPAYAGPDPEDAPVIEGVVSNMSGNDAVAPWFLVDLSKPLKPILYQDRQKPTFAMVTDPEDSHVFKTGEYLLGSEARGAAGYTYWQLAHRCTGAPTPENYEAAVLAMSSLLDENGDPLEIQPTHVVYGASNKAAIKKLIAAQNKAGGESNTNWQDVELIQAPRLR